MEQKTTTSKSGTGTRIASGDRYALLQRKVEELERLHAESKKNHLGEVERLKLELSRAQATHTEQTGRNDKLKKQNDALDTRVQELKRINLSDQSEIKDLRAKLRVSEHERTQLASKQGETGEAKKALQSLDAKRRDEVRERDKKISELEKALALEKKRKDGLEVRLSEINGKVGAEVQEARAAALTLESELQETKLESEKAKSALANLKSQAKDAEEELLSQLEQHRLVLSRVAEEYGRLASSTVSTAEYERTKHESVSLKLRILRLERKLANAEDQVVEVANLVRATKEDNTILSKQLREVAEEAMFYSSALSDLLEERIPDPTSMRVVEEAMTSLRRNIEDSRLAAQAFSSQDRASWAEFDHMRTEQLLLHSSFLVKHLDEAQALAEQQRARLADAENRQSQSAAELSTASSRHDTIQVQLVEATASLAMAKVAEEMLKKEAEETQKKSKAEVARLEGVVKQERETNQRLASAVQQGRAAEEALNAEIDQLATDLAEAERYQEAYTNLVEEVDSLISRNALAEEEAHRLSKFNAEILGHHNPAQRIMYVDKIRRELHDTKQQLLISTRDRDTVLNENDDLRNELELYKSVAVPLNSKPRTSVTRVTRIPLTNQSMNTSANTRGLAHTKSTNNLVKRLETTPELEYKEGDMTVEEIL
ncbi:hypothetical protein EW026_g1833 [Hermanssonia centrifuga]|uniref:Hyaluronan-mediated motility receptor C-terminal domain-containing protein n=1 Tax=Hermanssonia centrifuga TaxID=98765 RepID=A0A4S4KQ90_9APHY|nr:hypothetical protein EW026_g1833 [Hermanssonia centrifuga]